MATPVSQLPLAILPVTGADYLIVDQANAQATTGYVTRRTPVSAVIAAGGMAANISYTPAGANAVTTTVQTKLRQTVSVDDFVGPSVTTTQSILNAQAALVAAGGGTLLFTQGTTYTITAAIPMQAGVTYKGGGRAGVDAAVPRGAKIVSSTAALFNNSASANLSGITFDGLTLQSLSGGGHIFDWTTIGLVSKVEIKNCVLEQANTGKSVICGVSTVPTLSTHGIFSVWFHHNDYSYAPSSTVSAIDIRTFTVNSIIMDTFWSTCTAQSVSGYPSITVESTNVAGSAFNVVIKQGTFEFANAGAIKLLSCYYSGIEQCVSYDINTGTHPLSNPTFQISKGTGPGSAMCWVKGCRSLFGTATYPDLRIDCATGGLYSVSESQFYWIDGVTANQPQTSLRGNSISRFENFSFLSLNEGVEHDLFFSGTDASSKSYSIWNGVSGASNGYLNFAQGAPVDGSGTAPVLSYLGGFSPSGLFQWGGSAVAPNLYITAGGLLYPNTVILRRTAITYSASMAVDNTYQSFTITATNGTAFTITNPLYLYDGETITFTIKNTSGGALGTATWGALYKLASWTQPATGYSRSITFLCDGTNFIELSRTAADVPN